MTGKAAQTPAGSLFFDCDSPLNRTSCAAFLAAGFTGAARYLSRVPGQTPGDLWQLEASLILASGLAIVPVQHVPAPGWLPTADKGTKFGYGAASNAARAGCPPGVNVWLDLEGVSPNADIADVIDYCEAWFDQVSKAMFVPGIYVGANCGLDSRDLYYALSFQHYWRGGSDSAPVPAVRGVQIVQRIEGKELAGVGYDTNTVQVDQKGGLPVWWVA